MGKGLKLVLILQAAIAVFLIGFDVQGRLSLEAFLEEEPLAEPISPGDQVRHYDPSHTIPRYSDPATRPEISLPDDLPPRLEFTLGETDALGPIVMVNGAIAMGDAQRFEAFLASLSSVPRWIAINSPGGIVEEALAIGALIRESAQNTAILAGMACLSSCPYVLAGGVERTVFRNAAVGLHQHFYETPGYMPVFLAVEDIQRSQGATMAYLIEMGVDPGVMVYGLNTPPDDIYVLVESELIASRLATEVAG